MAINNTRLSTTGATTVFDAVGQQAITVIYLCNTTVTACTATVFVIDSGDGTASSASNMVYSQLSLAANATHVISMEKLILDDNDLIKVQASVANCITVTVSSIAV
jgi:hypothetical protein|tara:strand:+ start:601 stop:918 length:318 start_codon:yes stop_codon:yes gene_type:complete